MVKDFKLTDDERMVGYYAGVIASSYFLSQLFSSFFWGWVSDKFGRRPVLLLGMVGTCITILVFGFSVNIYMAISARFMFGLLNGNIGVFKTYLGEITDSTNQGKAFSMIGLTYGIGALCTLFFFCFIFCSNFFPLKKNNAKSVLSLVAFSLAPLNNTNGLALFFQTLPFPFYNSSLIACPILSLAPLS